MSVLKDMTTGIMTTKATKAARLTPVAGESPTTVQQAAAALGIPDIPEVFLTNEAVTDIARDLRAQAITLLAVADALDRRTGVPSERFDVTKATVESRRKAEREADARVAAAEPTAPVLPDVPAVDGEEPFTERMKRLTAEAQAATFKAADDDGQTADPQVSGAWVCEVHPDVKPISVKARDGRSYSMCGDDNCERYEK